MPPLIRPEVGDYMPDFQLLDTNRTLRSLLSLSVGKPVVALFYLGNGSEPAKNTLRGFAEVNGALAERATVFAISGEGPEANMEFSQEAGLPFPLLADPEKLVIRLYDLPRAGPTGNGSDTGDSVACIIGDANRRIIRIDPCVTGPDYAQDILAFIQGLPEEEPHEVGSHAPVLVIPQVFDPEFCLRLIRQYETAGSEPTGLRRGEETVFDADSKIRTDHVVEDPVLNQEIRSLLTKRVMPELSKCFGFQAKRGEAFKIACYDAKDHGFFKAHRDNCNPVGGRRFAMSLNLNTGEFEGGYLKFPEYPGHLYRPAAGDALLFSCLLAHEATPVTAGRRFALLTFFHQD